MVNIVVVSHHTLAKSLVETLEMIAGQSVRERITFFTLQADQGISSYREELDVFLKAQKQELLVFCDLDYGSPITSLYVMLCETKIRHKIISGVNLAMMLVAYTNLDKELDALTELILQETRASIKVCFEKVCMNKEDE